MLQMKQINYWKEDLIIQLFQELMMLIDHQDHAIYRRNVNYV